MGEYYKWVNVDRKEYLSPMDFDLGLKSHESIWRGNALLCALRELLSREWSGDHIFFLGDYIDIPADTENETLRILYRQSPASDAFTFLERAEDFVFDNYRNVSALFRAAEAEARPEIDFYLEDVGSGCPEAHNEYGVNTEHPFEGLFLREGKDFRFTVDHTKRVCYSFEETRILQSDGSENTNADPLPMLMGFGQTWGTGVWVGDVVGVSEELPEGYEVLKEIRLDW